MKLTSDQQKQINQLGQKYNLKLIVLHGSRVTRKAHKESDVDIAVLGFKPVPFENVINLVNDFSSILKTNNMDVKSLHKQGILFKYQVMKDAKLLYGNITDFNQFQVYAINSYFDAKDLFKLEREIVNKRQKHLMAKIKKYD